jgi:hypothetical protein
LSAALAKFYLTIPDGGIIAVGAENMSASFLVIAACSTGSELICFAAAFGAGLTGSNRFVSRLIASFFWHVHLLFVSLDNLLLL